ncbi:MAG: hypothetical protein AAFV29_27445, partial [Myxococcota bacterium]
DRRVPAQVENANPLTPDHPMIDGLNVLSRGPRRMSVAQLARSIETFGQLPAGSIVFPTDLARSLGQPDYLQTTEENLEPTPLFMKFMIDLGGLICGELAANDEARPQDERIFTRFTDRQDNLRHALRQATGIDGDEAAPYVERLQRVFEAGQRGPRGDISGYEAVCIALITSPEFLLY